jgi:hypothetical protein
VSRVRTFVVQAAFIAAALAIAGGALAAKPKAYQGVAGNVQSQVQKGAAPANVATVGQLPFTGLDLGLFAGAGVLVVLAGMSFRRLGRKRS